MYERREELEWRPKKNKTKNITKYNNPKHPELIVQYSENKRSGLNPKTKDEE